MTLGMVYALLAALSWGAADVFARRAMAHLPRQVAVMTAMVVIVLGLTTMAAITSGADAFVSVPGVFFAWVALMAVFGYVTGQLMHFVGLHRAGVTIAAPIIGTSPLFALLLAVILGSERPNLPTVVGALAIVAGAAVILSDRNRVLR